MGMVFEIDVDDKKMRKFLERYPLDKKEKTKVVKNTFRKAVATTILPVMRQLTPKRREGTIRQSVGQQFNRYFKDYRQGQIVLWFGYRSRQGKFFGWKANFFENGTADRYTRKSRAYRGKITESRQIRPKVVALAEQPFRNKCVELFQQEVYKQLARV